MASKPKCKYGKKCYRKNPQHLEDFDHTEGIGKDEEDENSVEEKKKNSDSEDENKKLSPTGGLKRKNTKESAHPKLKKRNTGNTSQKTTLHTFFGGGKKKEVAESQSQLVDTDSCEADMNYPEPHEMLALSSNDAENKVKCLTREEVRSKISELYQMEMPDDFYKFWDFCKTINKSQPASALSDVGLHLVGPYDIFTGKHEIVKADTNFNLHYRYYYDPPEFMTVLSGNEKQFHIGYFRDDPHELPAFVAANSADDNYLISCCGENVFAALKWYLGDKQKKLKEKCIGTILKQLDDFASKEEICLDMKTKKLKERQKKVVSKTFHGAGLVVPVVNDVGYRPVPETPANLKTMFQRIIDSKSEKERNLNMEPLEEIITFVQFANDECDYGEGVELGLDLFSYGNEELHPFVSSLLIVGYKLLNRELYSEIIKAFLPLRRKDRPLNMLTMK